MGRLGKCHDDGHHQRQCRHHRGIRHRSGAHRLDGDRNRLRRRLAIYDDLFRVGDTISYVLFGSNTIPASAGGSCATGRIVNNKVNSIFNNNYGLYIDVKNGNRNYGIWSNASVIAPACIGNKIKNVYFTGSGYTIDFSQFNIFFVYANQKYSVTLPSHRPWPPCSVTRLCRRTSPAYLP